MDLGRAMSPPHYPLTPTTIQKLSLSTEWLLAGLSGSQAKVQHHRNQHPDTENRWSPFLIIDVLDISVFSNLVDPPGVKKETVNQG
jgi:hypothetical protein